MDAVRPAHVSRHRSVAGFAPLLPSPASPRRENRRYATPTRPDTQRKSAAVRPRGLRIKVVDAWRSVATQAGLWSFFWDQVGRERPELDSTEREAIVKTFVSDPRRFDPADDTTWPIHSTGGSVDVMLIDADGAMLDHGAGFDEAHERSYTDHYERLLARGEIAPDDNRLVNRRILVNAMVNAGFTNYAYEFWHFDYGTQLHVLTLAQGGASDAPTKAWYGTTSLPEGMS